MIVVYGDQYKIDFQGHVFPVEKYGLIFERINKAGIAADIQNTQPRKARQSELLAVHTQKYLNDVLNLRWTEETASSELPLTQDIVDFFLYTAGGSIVAAEKAIEYGAAYHIGGGFHHAFSDHAEGFCYINDIAVAVKAVLSRDPSLSVLVFDCDLHQGNGTAKIFEKDENVFTCSIHQENLYPYKQKSDLDFGLSDFADDSEYLATEKTAIDLIFKNSFDLAFYIAGADPFIEDKLGTLQITKDGLRGRDKQFFAACKVNNVKVVVLLAGGYAVDTDDVVDIHHNTFMELLRIFQR